MSVHGSKRKKTRKDTLKWDRQSIRRILKNRAYTGLAGFCKSEKCEGDSQRIIRAPKSGRRNIPKFARKDIPEENWITIPVPVIVPDNLYRTVQEKLNNAQKFASRNTRKPSILQGVLVCGKCGASYYKKSRTNAYTYYSCHRNLDKSEKSCGNRSIRQKELDDYIWNWIISILRNPELIKAEIKRRAMADPNRNHAIERKMTLQKDLNRITTSRNKLLDAYTEGDCLSLEELKKRMQVVDQHTKQINRELSVLVTQMADEEHIKQSQLTLEKFSKSLDNAHTNLTVDEKQRIVRALIHEVIIYEDTVKIKHCIPMKKELVQKSKKCPLQMERSIAASRLISLFGLHFGDVVDDVANSF